MLELVLPKLPIAPPAGGVAADGVATGGVADNGVPKLGNLKAAGETVFVAGRPGARESAAVADGDPTMVGALKTRIQSNNSKQDIQKKKIKITTTAVAAEQQRKHKPQRGR